MPDGCPAIKTWGPCIPWLWSIRSDSMLDYKGMPIKMPDDPGVAGRSTNESGMVDYSPITITKSTPISIGLMVVICGALMWSASKMSSFETKLETKLASLSVIQQDIREIKQIMTLSYGVDERQDAELKAGSQRDDRQDVRIDALEKDGR